MALRPPASNKMQVMVWDVEDNAGRERSIVNPSNSHALKYLSNKRKGNDGDIFMYNKTIKDSKSATHLGIVQNVNGKQSDRKGGEMSLYSARRRVSIDER